MKPNGEAITAAAKVTAFELLDYGDLDFVRRAYQAVLGREADPDGTAHYVVRLRRGADKAVLLAEMASSLEGCGRADRLAGLDELVAQSRKPEPSLWARLLHRLFGSLRSPPESLDRGWRIVDNHLHRLEAAAAQQAAELAMVRAQLSALIDRPHLQVRDAPAAAAAPAALLPARAIRQVPPRAQMLLDAMRRTRTLRFGTE